MGLLVFGVAIGAIAALFVWPRLEQVILRRVIRAAFVSRAQATPYHLHTAATFHRLITEGSPGLASRLHLKTTAKILQDLQSKFLMIGPASPKLKNKAGVAQLLPKSILASTVMDGHAQGSSTVISLKTSPLEHFVYSLPADPHLPGEYTPLDAVLLSWPANYPGRWAPHAQFADAIFRGGARPVILVPTPAFAEVVADYLAETAPNCRALLLPIPTNDIWIRDNGPHFVRTADERFAVVATPYVPTEHNYQKHDNTSQLQIAAAFGLPFHNMPLVVEGGNMVFDGAGTMIMFDSVLHHNPEIARSELELMLKQWLGVERLLMFPSLKDEITGHADMVLKFVDESTVLVAQAKRGHRWFEDFERIAATLESETSIAGKPLKVVRIPISEAAGGGIAFWSYVNSLIVNNLVIVPSFDEVGDARAEEVYRSVGFTDIVFLDYRDFPLGSVHCQSKEVPSGALQYLLEHQSVDTT